MPAKRRRGGVLLGSLALAILIAVGIGAALGSGSAEPQLDPGPAKTRIPGVAAAGSPAPAFDLPRLTGPGRVTLAALQGRPVIVNFWASWCVECREEFATLHDLAAHRPKDLAIIGITYRDLAPDSRRYARQHRANWTMAQGGEQDATARAYGIRAIPQTFFIDRKGVIRARSFGLPARAALDGAVARIVRR